MGRSITERLIDLGEELTVWNRTREKASGLTGIPISDCPAHIVSQAELVLSVLADDAAVDTVYFGRDGLLSASLEDRLIVELCTMSPRQARRLETAVKERGGRFLECPVGGTVAPARSGKLLGLAGGDREAFEAARPILKKLTRRLEHLGPVGTGAAMKLAINLPLMVYWNALGEALGLALGQGVDVGLALDVLADSSGAIGAARTRVPPIEHVLTGGGSAPVNFTLANGIKDMRLMEDLAVANGSGHDVLSAALSRAVSAADAGFLELDCSLVAAFGQQVGSFESE